MERAVNPRRNFVICVALLALTFAAFWPVLECDFVQFDDPHYVTENRHVLGGLSWANTAWAFKTGVAGNWHPVTWLSHMVDAQWYGLRPAGHHLTSVLLHAANALLLFWFLQVATGAVGRSTVVASLFAVHPLRVESVAWIAERKDVLSMFFFLLTLIAYTRYARQKSESRKPNSDENPKSEFQQVPASNATAATMRQAAFYYLLALFLFALGLMSKPMLVTLPFLLLLLDYWPLGRLRPPQTGGPGRRLRDLLLEKLPFLLLSVAVCLITVFFQRAAGAVSSFEALPLGFRLANALISYVRYLAMTCWPSGLAVFYPTPTSWPLASVAAAALLLVGVTLAVVRLGRGRPWLPAGWLWFIGTLVPVIGLVQVGQQAMADRYSYIPQIGLLIVLVWAFGELAARWPVARLGLRVATLIVLGASVLATRAQTAHWRNNGTLFTRALAVTRENAVAHNNLGVSLLSAGETAGAETNFFQATQLKPNYADALVNLALCREKQDRLPEAVELLERALRAGDYAAANYDLANVLVKLGRLEDAEPRFLAAIRLNPEFPEAHYNLGILKEKLGRPAEAEAAFNAALRLNPGYNEVHQSLGALLLGQKRYDEGIAHFEAALRSSANSPDAHFNLAAALLAAGRPAQAEPHYAETCRLRPQDLEARLGLGMSLLQQGRMPEAAAQFEEVLRSRPDAQVHYYFALALDSQGQTVRALAHYRDAVRLGPTTPVYLNDLAWMLATNPKREIRDGAEAVKLAEEACRLSGGKEARYWGTLDAAYAEVGRFEAAIATATRARDMARSAGQADVAKGAEERLAVYQQKQAYHTNP